MKNLENLTSWVVVIFCLSLLVFLFVRGSEFTTVELISKIIAVNSSIYLLWYWVFKSPFAIKNLRKYIKDED